MSCEDERLRLSYTISRENIPPNLPPLLGQATLVYQRHHDINAVYLFGSAALGEFKNGISDLDMLGVTEKVTPVNADQKRRDALLELGEGNEDITFIDNAVVSMEEIDGLKKGIEAPIVSGRVFQIATSGICLWGSQMDVQGQLPTVKETAYSRTERVRLLMKKYRSGDLIKPFQREPILLSRSCAKAVMRVISGMTILRGALFYPSPYRTANEVQVYAREAVSLTDQAMQIIDKPKDAPPPQRVMRMADQAIDLFYCSVRPS